MKQTNMPPSFLLLLSVTFALSDLSMATGHAPNDSLKVFVSEGCAALGETSDVTAGGKELSLTPGAPLVLTHQILLVPSGSGPSPGPEPCSCECGGLSDLHERMEHLEREVSALREKCGDPESPGCCSSRESKGPGCSASPEPRVCPDGCSNHGHCVGGACLCDPGFSGDNCSVSQCPDDCSSRGHCVGGACLCDPGFSGDNCSVSQCPDDCSSRGHCVGGACICDPGFSGDDCSEKSCPGNCSSRGRCVKGRCVCRKGFSGNDCGRCQDGLSGDSCDTAMEFVEDLQVKDLSSSSVTLSWTQPRVQYETYVLTFTSQKDGADLSVVVPGGLTTFSQTGLAPGQSYSVTVRGNAGGGRGATGGRGGATASTDFTTLPVPPSDLRIVKTSTSSVVVQWRPSPSDVDRYRLTASRSDGHGRVQELTFDPSDSSAHITQLEAGLTYTITLVGERGRSQSESISTEATPGSESVSVSALTGSTPERDEEQKVRFPIQNLPRPRPPNEPLVSNVTRRVQLRPETFQQRHRTGSEPGSDPVPEAGSDLSSDSDGRGEGGGLKSLGLQASCLNRIKVTHSGRADLEARGSGCRDSQAHSSVQTVVQTQTDLVAPDPLQKLLTDSLLHLNITAFDIRLSASKPSTMNADAEAVAGLIMQGSTPEKMLPKSTHSLRRSDHPQVTSLYIVGSPVFRKGSAAGKGSGDGEDPSPRHSGSYRRTQSTQTVIRRLRPNVRQLQNQTTFLSRRVNASPEKVSLIERGLMKAKDGTLSKAENQSTERGRRINPNGVNGNLRFFRRPMRVYNRTESSLGKEERISHAPPRNTENARGFTSKGAGLGRTAVAFLKKGEDVVNGHSENLMNSDPKFFRRTKLQDKTEISESRETDASLEITDPFSEDHVSTLSRRFSLISSESESSDKDDVLLNENDLSEKGNQSRERGTVQRPDSRSPSSRVESQFPHGSLTRPIRIYNKTGSVKPHGKAHSLNPKPAFPTTRAGFNRSRPAFPKRPFAGPFPNKTHVTMESPRDGLSRVRTMESPRDGLSRVRTMESTHPLDEPKIEYKPVSVKHGTKDPEVLHVNGVSPKSYSLGIGEGLQVINQAENVKELPGHEFGTKSNDVRVEHIRQTQTKDDKQKEANDPRIQEEKNETNPVEQIRAESSKTGEKQSSVRDENGLVILRRNFKPRTGPTQARPGIKAGNIRNNFDNESAESQSRGQDQAEAEPKAPGNGPEEEKLASLEDRERAKPAQSGRQSPWSFRNRTEQNPRLTLREGGGPYKANSTLMEGTRLSSEVSNSGSKTAGHAEENGVSKGQPGPAEERGSPGSNEDLRPESDFKLTVLGPGSGVLSRLHKLVISTGPEPPSDLVFSHLTEDSVTVSWTKPKSQLSGFKVTYTHSEEGEPVSVSLDQGNSSVSLSRLVPGSEYEVSVLSVMGLDESDAVSGTFYTLPDPPTDLRAVNVTDSGALLLWRPSLATIEHYTIVYGAGTDTEVRVTVSGNEAQTELNKLQPNTRYSVTISSHQRAVASRGASTSFTTSVSGSAGPGDLRAFHVRPRTASLSWRPPTWPVIGYRLVYWTEGQRKELTVASTLTQLNLTKLIPGSHYSVELRTEGGDDVLTTDFTTGSLQFPFPADCSEEHLNGFTESGLVDIFPLGQQGAAVSVWCDMDTDGGGWTVFQRRKDGSVDFFRTWKEYVKGFGDASGEFWLGLDALHALTSLRRMALRVDLSLDQDTAFAQYSTFEVGKRNYRLTVGGYSGTAGDSMAYHNNKIFSTKDRDPASFVTRCAVSYRGGWWYKNCHEANLNGVYGVSSRHQGIVWTSWKGKDTSISFTEMKMRPTDFLPNKSNHRA